MTVKTTHEGIRKKNMTAIALLALGALRVLRGEETARFYTGTEEN